MLVSCDLSWKGVPMKKVLGFIVIAFTLFAGTAAVMTVNPQQAFACEDGDHRGS